MQGSNYRRLRLLKINHTKKPTVGFLPFTNWRKVISMMDYKNISGKQTNGSRPPSFSTTARHAEWTRIYANLGERDRLAAPKRSVGGPGRRVWRLAEHILVCFLPSGAGRETHPAATGQAEQHKSGPRCGLVALPMNRISEYLRLLAFIHAATLHSSKARNQLMQVVDFHDSFRYFRIPLRRFRVDSRPAGSPRGLRFYHQSLHCPLLVCPLAPI